MARKRRRTELPDELRELAVKGGAKPQSIRRYAETYRMMGAMNARLHIESDNWFRRNWYRRHEFTGDIRKQAEELEK